MDQKDTFYIPKEPEQPVPGEYINREVNILHASMLISTSRNHTSMDEAQARALIVIADAMVQLVQRLDVIIDLMGGE